MASKEWLGQAYVKEFERIGEIKNTHPAIRSLCYAMSHLHRVRPTSLTQQEYLVHTFEWIIRAINEITDFEGDFIGVNLKSPMQLLFDSVQKEESPQNALPFRKGDQHETLG